MRAPLLAMVDKLEIEGDDSLLQLARVRLEAAGLGAELFPTTPASSPTSSSSRRRASAMRTCRATST